MSVQAPLELKQLLQRSDRIRKELHDWLQARDIPLPEAFVALRACRTSMVLVNNCPEQEVTLLESLVDGVLRKKTPSVIGDASLRLLARNMGLKSS